MKPQKMPAYASYAEWKRAQSAKNRTLISALERLVKQTAPDLIRTVKWGQGCFIKDTSPVVYIHAAADHVQFGFYRGAALRDPQGLLAGSGKYVRHVNVYRVKDIPSAAFVAFLKQVR